MKKLFTRSAVMEALNNARIKALDLEEAAEKEQNTDCIQKAISKAYSEGMVNATKLITKELLS